VYEHRLIWFVGNSTRWTFLGSMWFANGKFYGFGVARGDLDYLFASSIGCFALPGCLTSSYIDVLG
jgi:hypothetical protein